MSDALDRRKPPGVVSSQDNTGSPVTDAKQQRSPDRRGQKRTGKPRSSTPQDKQQPAEQPVQSAPTQHVTYIYSPTIINITNEHVGPKQQAPPPQPVSQQSQPAMLPPPPRPALQPAPRPVVSQSGTKSDGEDVVEIVLRILTFGVIAFFVFVLIIVLSS